MNQSRIVGAVIVVIVFSGPAFGQFRLQPREASYPDRPIVAYVLEERGEAEQLRLTQQADFFDNILGGLGDTFRWWDIPLASATILPEVVEPKNQDARLRFPTLGLDIEISRQVARKDDGTSLGSSDPARFPQGALAVQFLSVGLLDILTDVPVTAEHYERVFVFQKALIYTRTLTGAAKQWFSRSRPDGSDTNSFFSAHTSVTFATSAFCYRTFSDFLDEADITRQPGVFRDVVKGTAFAGFYGWAAYVGYSRMRDSKHYLTDVLVGAAAGTIISNLLYTLHFDTDKKAGGGQRVSFEIAPMSEKAIGLLVRF
ncbi:MAG: phosphatase PAP2 family protein [Ignavibacteriales bacterium]|nr:phosphatase PAP2 family protein [Ignavibacteriales bacterium]